MKLKSAKEFSLFAKIMRLLVPAALICTALFNVPVFGQIKKARVLVDSYADEGYLDTKETNDGLRPETYHIVERKFVGAIFVIKVCEKFPSWRLPEILR